MAFPPVGDKDRCINCTYFHDKVEHPTKGFLGKCIRFPETQKKYAHEWCGEFKDKDGI